MEKKKRKKSKPKKWYVVWRGVKPGIYETWGDCVTIGRPEYGAYKSFSTFEEAYAAYHNKSFKRELPKPEPKVKQRPLY